MDVLQKASSNRAHSVPAFIATHLAYAFRKGPEVNTIENELEELQDKVMAMEFAFNCLAKALHQQGLLPIPDLQERLGQVARQLRDGDDPQRPEESLTGVAAQLVQLRDVLGHFR